jgi:hypothetical protein
VYLITTALIAILAPTLFDALMRLLILAFKPVPRAPTIREHLERCGYFWHAGDMAYLDAWGYPITSEQLREALQTFE